MVKNAAKTVIFSFTGKVLDVHAVEQDYVQVQDEKDSNKWW